VNNFISIILKIKNKTIGFRLKYYSLCSIMHYVETPLELKRSTL